MDDIDQTLDDEGRETLGSSGEDSNQTLDAQEGQTTPVSERDIDRGGMTISQFLSSQGLEGGVDLNNPEGSSATHSLKDRQGRKYDMGKLIAQGGMGAVISAKDHCIRRNVAMKVMHKNMQSPKAIVRFIEEAQVTGQLEHPSIVPVHELGVDSSGTVFYTMKYVKGRTLKDVLDAIRDGDAQTIKDYPLVRLLGIFLRVCDAMAFAHAHHVIHRDLKPENIMLGDYGEVLVVDWGLAKVMGENASDDETQAEPEAQTLMMVRSDRVDDKTDSVHTLDGDIMGTPAFMSPEQAAGRLAQIDERADIYSLGAVLYRILTLSKPVQGKDVYAILENVTAGNITHPTMYGRATGKVSNDKKGTATHKAKSKDEHLAVTLHHCPGRRVPGSMAAVAMKSLETDADDRYGTVQALQQDVQTYLDGFATSAEHASLIRQCVLLFNRHKKEAAVLTGAFLLVVAITLGFIYQLNEKKQEAQTARFAAEVSAQKATVAEDHAKDEAENARQSQKIAERNAYYSDMLLLQKRWQDASVTQFHDILESYRDREDLRGWEWDYWSRMEHNELLSFTGHNERVSSVAFSPDGTRLASASWDRTVMIWDAVTAQAIFTLKGHTHKIESVAFSSDGNRVASGGKDRTVRVWDANTGQELFTCKGHGGFVQNVAFSPDGTRLASASWDKTVKVWDAHTGQLRHTYNGHASKACGVAFSPDGARLATSDWDGKVKIWDADTGQDIHTLDGHQRRINGVAFSPDGSRLASASSDRVVKLWDTTTGKQLLALNGHISDVISATFSPDGTRLATASWDATARLWDTTTGQETLALKGHALDVLGVAFSPDGAYMVTASSDKTLKAWDVSVETEARTLSDNHSPRNCAAMSPDGTRIAVINATPTIQLRDVASGQKMFSVEEHTAAVICVAFSKDSTLLASGSEDNTVKLWDVATGKLLHTLEGHAQRISDVSFSPDGTRLASASWDHTVKVWDTATGQETLTFKDHTLKLNKVAFSPDGIHVASGDRSGKIAFWNAHTGQEKFQHVNKSAVIHGLAFSAKGERLGVSYLGRVLVFDTDTGQEMIDFVAHAGTSMGLAFSPNDRRIVSAGRETTARLWDPATGQETLTFQKHTGPVNAVQFTADGTRMLTASQDGTTKLLDTRPWTAPLRAEAQARGYMAVHTQRAESLQALQNYIRDDKTINELVRTQALAWAELFWKNREASEQN